MSSPGSHDNKVSIIFILNGEDVPVSMPVSAPLHAAVERALEQTQNTARPGQDWEVRDAGGALLDQSRKLEEYRFENGVRLFLNLAVGAGG